MKYTGTFHDRISVESLSARFEYLTKRHQLQSNLEYNVHRLKNLHSTLIFNSVKFKNAVYVFFFY